MDWHQHRELLQRWPRTQALQRALHEAVRPGMRVLDAGCGTGILSLLAARLGASAVLGVDLADTAVAAALAAENELAQRVTFLRADLRELNAEAAGGRFDLLIAMIYLNDPRRDEARTQLAAALKERLLAPNGDLIPDRVVYSAALWDWPDQDAAARRDDIRALVSLLEERLALRLTALAELWQTEPDRRAFPPREADGRLHRPGARQLSPWTPAITIDYRQGVTRYPDQVRLTVDQPGRAKALIWQQDLLYRGQLLFRNESVSWLDPATPVLPGETYALALDARWRASNLLTLRLAPQK